MFSFKTILHSTFLMKRAEVTEEAADCEHSSELYLTQLSDTHARTHASSLPLF